MYVLVGDLLILCVCMEKRNTNELCGVCVGYLFFMIRELVVHNCMYVFLSMHNNEKSLNMFERVPAMIAHKCVCVWVCVCAFFLWCVTFFFFICIHHPLQTECSTVLLPMDTTTHNFILSLTPHYLIVIAMLLKLKPHKWNEMHTCKITTHSL